MLNQLGNLEDHVGTHPVLFGLAVHLEPEADFVYVWQLGLFDEWPAIVITRGDES
jgi:hypothetical protein